jgi:hypothetical protein
VATCLTNPPFTGPLTRHGSEGAILDAIRATDRIHGEAGEGSLPVKNGLSQTLKLSKLQVVGAVSHRRKPSRERSGSGKFSLVALDARKI